jgi:uncharacterized damage-inducible protein DinB
MKNSQVLYYSNRFQEIYNGSPWYGETVDAKLNDVSDSNAFLQPVNGVHSVGEIVSHMIYWRKALIGKLEGGTFKTSMESPDNWKDLKALKASGWKKLKSAFDKSQQTITSLLAKQSDDFLKTEYSQGTSMESLIQGIIDHDIYHLGQIGLVKRMLGS